MKMHKGPNAVGKWFQQLSGALPSSGQPEFLLPLSSTNWIWDSIRGRRMTWCRICWASSSHQQNSSVLHFFTRRTK